MGPILFTSISIAFASVWLLRGVIRLPLKPAIANLPIIFSICFCIFYAQHYFVSEVVLGIPVRHWLSISEQQKNSATTFLIVYLVAFWLGYLLHARRIVVTRISKQVDLRFFGVFLWIAAFSAFAVYIYVTGGLLIFVSNHREFVYQDQWLRTAEAVVFNQMRVFTTAIMMIASVIGGYLAGSREKSKIWFKALCYTLPLPITLVKVALLSRGFFLFYGIFFIAKMVSGRKKGQTDFIKVAMVFSIVMIGVVLALLARSDGEVVLGSLDEHIYFMSQSVNGLSGFLDSYAITVYSGMEGVVRVLLELAPVPSFIYSLPYDNNLSSLALGQSSGSSAPMPFIGEVYYNLAWFGLIVAYGQGWFSAIVSTKIADQNARDRGWWLALYIGTIYSFLYMAHSGIRSSTRFIVWIVVFYLASKTIKVFLPKRSASLRV